MPCQGPHIVLHNLTGLFGILRDSPRCMEQEEETAAARARGDSPPAPASDADAKALVDAAVHCFLLCQAQRFNCSSRA